MTETTVNGANPYVLVYFDLETQETVVESTEGVENTNILLRQALYIVKEGVNEA